MKKILLCLSPLVFLSACASLSEDECRGGDWRAIGYQDGKIGRYPTYLSEHAEACSEYGIAPNQSLWMQGRAEGLKHYCTVENAYRKGRNGTALNGVCSRNLSALEAANDHGFEYYKIGRKIARIESEIEEIERTLDQHLEDGVISPEEMWHREGLRRDLRRLERDVQELIREQRQYAELP